MPTTQLIEEALKEFDKIIGGVIKPTLGNNDVPTENMVVHCDAQDLKDVVRDLLTTIATKSAEMERKKITDDVMIEIDGHYDNPNLVGNLEDYFGITYREWEEQE